MYADRVLTEQRRLTAGSIRAGQRPTRAEDRVLSPDQDAWNRIVTGRGDRMIVGVPGRGLHTAEARLPPGPAGPAGPPLVSRR